MARSFCIAICISIIKELSMYIFALIISLSFFIVDQVNCSLPADIAKNGETNVIFDCTGAQKIVRASFIHTDAKKPRYMLTVTHDDQAKLVFKKAVSSQGILSYIPKEIHLPENINAHQAHNADILMVAHLQEAIKKAEHDAQGEKLLVPGMQSVWEVDQEYNCECVNESAIIPKNMLNKAAIQKQQ